MKTDLSSNQIAQYQDQGFLMIEDFLSPDELHELKTAVTEAVDQLGDKKIAGGGADWVDGDDYYSKVFKQKLNLWKVNETVKSAMLSPALGELLCKLAGVDGMRVWHDQALIKQPWGNPTGWHLDNPYWSFYSRNAISIWIALEDATYQNGCLYFIPGTHKSATFDNVGIGQNVGTLFDVYTEWKGLDAVAAPMRAGSASFHNGLTAHGAGANMTPRTRMAMTCGYMPEGSVFNGTKNILPPRLFDSLKIGDVLQDDEQNPMVFRK